MQKRPLQDIVVKQKHAPQPAVHAPRSVPPPTTLPPSPRTRSVREQPVPDPSLPASVETVVHRERPPMRPLPTRMHGSRRQFPWLWVAGVVSIVILVGAFVLSMIFSGATVTVHPREQKAFIDGTFVASREALTGQVPYELLTLEKTLTTEVAATGEEEVEDRATGRITISNTVDTAPQRLIKNTRFESAEGKIFRIQDSVTVPGAIPGADGTLKPGSIEVTVFADEPGDEYNIAPGRFTIPGFKGTPRFDSFTAESKENMRGGFAGVRKTVAPGDADRSQAQLEADLREALLEEAFAAGTKPEDFYLYRDAVFFRSEALPETSGEGTAVTLSRRGQLHAILVKKDTFARFIATQAVAGYDNESVAILNPDELVVTASELPEETSPQKPWEGGSVSLSIKGTAHVVWTYDQAALANDLAGRDTNALKTILSGYSGIDKATVVHRPFWKQTFPESAQDIEVVEALD